MPPNPPPSDLLVTIAEPTRLRILNCLAAAPLFVSDLQLILDLPQPTVSRHLTVLRVSGIVQDTPVGQYVLYRLRRAGWSGERLINAVLEALVQEETMRLERHRARDQSRSRTRVLLSQLPP